MLIGLAGPVPSGAATAAAATGARDFSARVRATSPGWVSVELVAPRGTTVAITEIGAASAGAGPVDAAAPAQFTLDRGPRLTRRLGVWSCEQRDRRFRVAATFPGGEGRIVERGVRTPSCATRVEVTPPAVAAGRTVRVQLRDRFALGGFTARVCLDGPTGPDRCTDAVFGPGKHTARAELGRAKAGRSTLTVTTPYEQTLRRTLVARRAGQRFTLLATGDSMIQIVDGYLKQRLAGKGGRVVSDAHISTGISKPAMLNWPQHAKSSASSTHPDVTVMILGANDGFPFGGTACCGDAWSGVYAARAEAMMRTYLRGGKGRVIWMLLPAPRGGNFATVFRGVNEALVKAAARFAPDQVTLLDLRKTFTPGGTYRGSIRWNGQTRHVRQEDGVHLNAAGASIAADLVIRQLRRDGFIG